MTKYNFISRTSYYVKYFSHYEESDDTVFWIYFVVRLVGTTMLAGSVTLMDPIALEMIHKYGGDFGKFKQVFITFHFNLLF